MPTENPRARQRGLALILAAIVLLSVNVFLAPELGATGSWVFVVLSVAVVAVLARWTWKVAGR